MKWQIVCCVRIDGEKIVSCTLNRQFNNQEEAEKFGDDHYSEIKAMVEEWEVASSENLTVLLFEVPTMPLS